MTTSYQEQFPGVMPAADGSARRIRKPPLRPPAVNPLEPDSRDFTTTATAFQQASVALAYPLVVERVAPLFVGVHPRHRPPPTPPV